MTAYDAVRRELDAAGVDLLVVGPTANLRYLVGYDALPTDRLLTLLVTRDAAVLVLPQMEVSAVVPRHGEVVLGWEDSDGPAGALEDAFSRLGPVATAAVEEWLPYRSVSALKPHVESAWPAGEILARPRLIKDEAELAGMAAAWADDVEPEALAGSTVSLTVDYVAAARGQDLLATATVARRGRSLAFTDVRVTEPGGRLVAKGSLVYRFG